jgi:Macrocin-O-methyltransferase (TylF)
MPDAPPSVVGLDSIASMVALAEASPPGCFVEVGVYKGGTAWHLARVAREQGRALHLFDTFTGIPHRDVEDNEHHIGDFGDTSFETVKAAIPDAIFHIGTFPESMPKAWLSAIAFVHVDCDQYRGINAAIQLFWSDMRDGSIMLFDDYGETSGCTKAVDQRFISGMIRRTPQGKAYVVKDGLNA